METTANAVISWMEQIARLLWSAAALLAPWLVPLAPASFFGWALFGAAQRAEMPLALAAAVGFVAALGLEAVNIAAAHAALRLSHNYSQHFGKFALSLFLIGFYIVAGIFGVSQLEVAAATRAIGIALFLLTPVAITAQALTMDLARVRQVEDDRTAWEREQAALAAEREHLLKIERARLNAQVRLEKTRSAERSADVRPRPERSLNSGEPPPEYAERLRTLDERAEGSVFGPDDVRAWLDVGKTTAYQTLNYGLEQGVIRQIGRGRYRANGHQ